MEKNDFYNQICDNYRESEIVEIISTNPACGFYELCQCFVDVALNAETFKDKSGVLKRLFKQEDINIVKAASLDFCNKNNIVNIDELFRVIKTEFHTSVSMSDDRRTEAMIKEDDQSINLNGYVGTMYFLNEISDDVYNKIIREIKLSLTPK